jgi:DNA-binding XRE family transcriptional regulator
MTKEERKQIIDAVKAHPDMTYEALAAYVGISRQTLLRAIKGKVQRPRGRKLNLKVGK